MVFNELLRMKRVIYKNMNSKQGFHINLQDPYKISQDIYQWALKKGKMGKIETFVFIVSGDHTQKTDSFYNLPMKTIEQAIEILQGEGKAMVR